MRIEIHIIGRNGDRSTTKCFNEPHESKKAGELYRKLRDLLWSEPETIVTQRESPPLGTGASPWERGA
jgi:hypothetical protein